MASFGAARKDPAWAARALVHMIELCLDLDSAVVWADGADGGAAAAAAGGSASGGSRGGGGGGRDGSGGGEGAGADAAAAAALLAQLRPGDIGAVKHKARGGDFDRRLLGGFTLGAC